MGLLSDIDEKSALWNFIKSGFTAPGRAYTGELDPYSPEAVMEAMNTAGLLMEGGIASSVASPTAYGELGINKLGVPSKDILGIISKIKSTGGDSVNLNTGARPTAGYMVAPSKTTEVMVPLADVSRQSIESYINNNAKLLRQPDSHLGAWLNSDNGNVYFDVSQNVPTQFRAIPTAKKADQEAIWDMRRMREIRTK